MGTSAGAAQNDGRAATDRGDGDADLEFAGDENERRIAASGASVSAWRMTKHEGRTNAQMTEQPSSTETLSVGQTGILPVSFVSLTTRKAASNEAQMTNDEGSSNDRMSKWPPQSSTCDSDFVIPSSLDIRHSSLSQSLIATSSQLAELLPLIERNARVAVDTEADSLHCYREKLCLLQVSLPEGDFLVDPLAGSDLAPLADTLARKEIVLHGADYDLRLLRRALNFQPARLFDTVIAARLLGVREFSYAALVGKYFGIELAKGSQKANWALRPLSPKMEVYARNDTHYLLPLAEKLEMQLIECGRFGWFQQSCERAIVSAAIDRERDTEEAWRVRGSGLIRGREAAILRALWHWRDRDFQATINTALALKEEDWPETRKRHADRPTREMERAAEAMRKRRDQAAGELKIEPSFIAPRATIDAIAADRARAEQLLVPWQRSLLGL